MRPSTESLQRLATRANRLYEQVVGRGRLRQDVTPWTRCLCVGLKAFVSRKGSIRRYITFVRK